MVHMCSRLCDASAPLSISFRSLQAMVDKYNTDLQEITRVVAELQTSLNQATEFDHVLIETGRLLRHRGMRLLRLPPGDGFLFQDFL